MYVVPLPSERCTTRMSFAGSFTPALSAAIRESFHLVILPAKIWAIDIAGELERLRDSPARLYVMTTAPSTVGMCRIGPFAFASSASRHRRIGRTEIHGPLGELADAAARADRLIVDLHARRGRVVAEPLAVDRIRKRRAGASEVGAAGGGGRLRGRSNRRRAFLSPPQAVAAESAIARRIRRCHVCSIWTKSVSAERCPLRFME